MPDPHTVIVTETSDLSRVGFSCVTNHPFSPGEHAFAVIQLSLEEKPSYLVGNAVVIRLIVHADGFTIGCKIDQPRVVAVDALPAWAQPPWSATEPKKAKAAGAASGTSTLFSFPTRQS